MSVDILTRKRLIDELEDLKKNPLRNLGITAPIEVNNNLFEWQCSIEGPKDSPYEGGLFNIRIYFPKDYPNNPPEICFKTPIYHLNVNPRKCEDNTHPERLGHICLSTLNWWKPKYTMREVLSNIFSFLFRTNPESPYGLDRKGEYLDNKKLFEEKAKHFTRIYAGKDRKEDVEFDDRWDFIY